MNDNFFLTMIEKFNSSAIAELEFSDGTSRLALRRESVRPVEKNTAANAELLHEHSLGHEISGTPAAANTVHINAMPDSLASAKTARIQTEGIKIKSPIVGTFYSAPGPDAPPFVKIGTKVKTGQTLCILEAMKMMNNLEAEFDCEIMEIHVSNGDLVEYEQDIFTVSQI